MSDDAIGYIALAVAAVGCAWAGAWAVVQVIREAKY